MGSDNPYVDYEYLKQRRAYWRKKQNDAKMHADEFQKEITRRDQIEAAAFQGTLIGERIAREDATPRCTCSVPGLLGGAHETSCPVAIAVAEEQAEGLASAMSLICTCGGRIMQDYHKTDCPMAETAVTTLIQEHDDIYATVAHQIRATDGPWPTERPVGKSPELGLPYKPDEHAEPFMGRHTIYSIDDKPPTPYMSRYWIGRLRLHIFHRGDVDADPHDHPWNFWTFPLVSYLEEVTRYAGERFPDTNYHPDAENKSVPYYETRSQVVKAWRLHYRPATHTHRVMGKFWGHMGITPCFKPGKIVTIVWRGGGKRAWGFLKNRDGKWCWIAWKKYVFEGGKHAPCE